MAGDKVELDRIPAMLINLKSQLDLIIDELQVSLKEFES